MYKICEILCRLIYAIILRNIFNTLGVQMRKGRLYGFANTPNRLSPSSHVASVDPIVQECPEVNIGVSAKVACRGIQATAR
jgi:hypothetical protein